MDFVERVLHIAPDYGSGSLETVIFLTILAAALTGPISDVREWLLVGALRRLTRDRRRALLLERGDRQLPWREAAQEAQLRR